jgi:rubrerythrin
MVMNQSEKNLKDAFAGESQAHMKYWIFSEKAESENMPNVARLFRAVSYAERIHAKTHLRILGGIGKTSDNLKTAIEGETYEVNEMYPSFIKTAIEEGNKRAEQSSQWAFEAEKIHKDMYTNAKTAADENRDLVIGSIQVCTICGYTAEGDAPDVCPICKAKKDKFKEF